MAKESTTPLEITAPSEIAEQSNMNELLGSLPDNNQISSNNINEQVEHVEPVVIHTQHPNGSEFESSSTVESSTPSSESHQDNDVNYPVSSEPKSSSVVKLQPNYTNELESVLYNANNAVTTSSKATVTSLNGSITPVHPTNPPPKPVNNKNRLLTKAKANTIAATIEHTGNQSINLTTNFEKKGKLTSQLKQQFRGLNQQLMNEGKNLSTSPGPAAKPTSASLVMGKPVTTSMEKSKEYLNSFNIAASKLPKYTPPQV